MDPKILELEGMISFVTVIKECGTVLSWIEWFFRKNSFPSTGWGIGTNRCIEMVKREIV